MAKKTNDGSIKQDPNNTRLHGDRNKMLIEKSLKELGAGRSIVIDNEGYIVAGNGVHEQAEKLGIKTKIIESDGEELIVIKRTDLSYDDEKRRALAVADNATGDTSEWAFDELNVNEIEEWGIDFKIKDQTGERAEARTKLEERFVIPPFSILDTRQGHWQTRKKHWRLLIDDNGESRESSLVPDPETNIMAANHNSASLLDPVLAELVNHWFGLPEGKTFDCFAGDSVFGYVSAHMGNTFTGIELRKEQAKLNNERVKDFDAKYICDDGQNVLKHIKPNTQDLLFSCPPYYDLEVYSDLQNDASNQPTYDQFLEILTKAFGDAIKCLKKDRFAVITVGDIRQEGSFYYQFVDDVKRIFNNNGMGLYNELILIETLGTLPQRVGRFMNNRKVGKCHQNVLVFYKGDTSQIKNIYPKIESKYNEGTDA